MINILIKAIFFVISKIADIILAPILAIISAILPELTIGLDNIFDFLELMTSKVIWCFKVLMMPNYCFYIVYLVTIFCIGVGAIRVYKFAIKLYNTLKP